MIAAKRTPNFLIFGLLGWSLALSGCGMLDINSACAAAERMPTPVSAANMNQLEATKEAITDFAIGNPTWQINMVDADETTGTVVVGTARRTAELCSLLHGRYGPLIEVIDQQPGLTGPATT